MIKLYILLFTGIAWERSFRRGCSNFHESKQEEKLIQTNQIPLAIYFSFSEDSESIWIYAKWISGLHFIYRKQSVCKFLIQNVAYKLSDKSKYSCDLNLFG